MLKFQFALVQYIDCRRIDVDMTIRQRRYDIIIMSSPATTCLDYKRTRKHVSVGKHLTVDCIDVETTQL